VRPTAGQLAAVNKMRGLLEKGELPKHYRAAIGLEAPEFKDEALRLFAALPKVTRATTASDLVALGLWTAEPRNAQFMRESPRYVVGRQVLVDTTVNPDAKDPLNFMAFKADGPKLRTYRASVVGEQGDSFLVRVDGRQEPLAFPKARVFEANQSHEYAGDVVQFRRDVRADYDSPLLKAKVAEAALRVAPIAEQIDFAKPQEAERLQRRAVQAIAQVMDMRYAKPENYQLPGRSQDGDAGRQAVCGIGSCFKQGGVLFSLLNPFLPSLGVDAQYMAGKTYTHLRTTPDADPFAGGQHGWLQLTYRPTLSMFVADPTWRRLDQPVDEAYSRAGRRYPGKSVSSGRPAPVESKDVNLGEAVAIKPRARAFGVEGQAGREIHQEYQP